MVVRLAVVAAACVVVSGCVGEGPICADLFRPKDRARRHCFGGMASSSPLPWRSASEASAMHEVRQCVAKLEAEGFVIEKVEGR